MSLLAEQISAPASIASAHDIAFAELTSVVTGALTIVMTLLQINLRQKRLPVQFQRSCTGLGINLLSNRVEVWVNRAAKRLAQDLKV